MPLETAKFYNSCLKLFKDPFPFEHFYKETEREDGGYKQSFSISDAIFHFMGRYDFLTFIDTKEIYYKDYNLGYYMSYGEEIINMELSRFEEEHTMKISDNLRLKILKEIKLRTSIERTQIVEYKYPFWLNFRNVWYNIETKQVFKHNYTIKDYTENETKGDTKEAKRLYEEQKEFESDKLFLTSVDIKYEKPSNCTNFQTFLERILPDKQSQDTIYELFGYCLYNGYPIQQAILFIGDGDNGKSTLLLVLKKFLGNYNVTAVDIYSLSEDRFATAELYMKKACINADLESKFLPNVGVLKRLTGGDMIQAQKKRKDPFYFSNTAKIILSMNQLFKVSDTDLIYSFFRRLCIIPFTERIPKLEKKDQEKLVNEITTDCELSGILIKSLDGLDRLLKNKSFSNKMDEEKLKNEWIKLSDPGKWFFDQIISEGNEEDKGEDYWQSDLFQIFIKICNLENLPEQSEQYFARMATKYGIKKKRKAKLNEGRKTMYLNLLFNNGYSELAFQLQSPKEGKTKNKQTKLDFRGRDEALRDAIENLLIIHEDGLSFSEIQKEMYAKKFTRDEINNIFPIMKETGQIYEPKDDKWKLNR